MAANKTVRFGPIALTATLTTNLLNPPTLTGGVTSGTSNTATYFLLKHVRVVGVSSTATCRFWLGATGANVAGTEVFGNPLNVGSGAQVDIYFSPALRMDSADFLVGGLSAGTGTMTIDGEIGIA